MKDNDYVTTKQALGFLWLMLLSFVFGWNLTSILEFLGITL